MPDINGIPYVESTDLVSAYPAASQALAQEVSDQLAQKLPYSYGTATPTTSDSGFLWYDSNSTPPVPKYWNGSAFANLAPASGPVILASEAITASSNFAIDGVFSADYHMYSIYYTLQPSTSLLHRLRWRASGVAATSANYDVQRFSAGSGVVSNSATSNETSGFLNRTNSANSAGQINIAYVFDSVTTRWQVIDFDGGQTQVSGWTHDVSTSYDGFEINTSTGTTTGNITVVGYPV